MYMWVIGGGVPLMSVNIEGTPPPLKHEVFKHFHLLFLPTLLAWMVVLNFARGYAPVH